jgi:methylaspartate mutase sigma subunit
VIDSGPRYVQKRSPNVLLATVSSDAHMWNLVFLQLLLEEHGCTVNNLGQCTPVDVVAEQALATRPDIIVISSVNGHGHLDGVKLARRLREMPELTGTRLVIGGKLGISGDANIGHADALVDSGFDAVFEASSDPRAAQRLIEMVATPVRAALTGGTR